MTAPAPARALPRAAALWAAYLALAAVLAAPLLGVEVPLGSDTLNHLARIHVRAHIAGDPDLAHLFRLRTELVPYMGLDWALTPLARVMPTLHAGRLAIVLMLWGTLGTVLAVQRAFTGRIGWEPLLLGLVSWNALLAWGFLNYILGVIPALLGLAAWHALRERAWPLRLAVFAAAATGIYYVHLLALGLYGAMLGAYEVFGRLRPWRTPARDWLLLAAQFVPAAVLWVRLAMPRLADDTGPAWSLVSKVLGLFSPFVFSGAMGGPSPGLFVAGGCALAVYVLTRKGLLRWDRTLGGTAAGLMLMGLLAPTWLGGVFLGDSRLPVAAAYLAAAAMRIAPGAGRRLLPWGLALAAAVLVQAGSAGSALRACDVQYAEVRAALQALPRGATLIPAQEDEPAPGVRCSDMRVYDHMAQLVTLERSGYSPTFFSGVTAVDVRAGKPYFGDPLLTKAVTPEVLQPGAYLLWMHLGHVRPLPPGLTVLRSGSFFDILAIP